jgi:hypothetical protein
MKQNKGCHRIRNTDRIEIVLKKNYCETFDVKFRFKHNISTYTWIELYNLWYDLEIHPFLHWLEKTDTLYKTKNCQSMPCGTWDHQSIEVKESIRNENDSIGFIYYEDSKRDSAYSSSRYYTIKCKSVDLTAKDVIDFINERISKFPNDETIIID